MSPELTADAFELLRALLDPNPDRAGEEYEHVRRILIDFFRWRGCPNPEDLSDDVFDRVAGQLQRGKNIQSPRAYFYAVARLVHLEQGRNADRPAVPLDDLITLADPGGDPYTIVERRAAEEDLARRVVHVQRCLDTLPEQSRRLFLAYHRGVGRGRIERRQQLALELGLSMNALRIRVCRIAEVLSACVEGSLRGTR